MEMKRMLRGVAAAVSCAAMMGNAAEPLCWERVPGRPAPVQFDTFHGESLDFRCTFTGFGALPFSGSGAVAPRLYYQTNGMAAAWWSLPATVSSNMLAATFPPSADPGAERLSVFFGAPSNAYAAAQVRFRNSPGPHPNDLDPPSVLDWQAELAAATNDLFKSFAPTITNTYTKAETDARITELAPRTSLAPATNYVDALRDDLVNGGLEVSTAQSAGYANEAETSASSGNAEYAENLTDHETDSRSATQIFSQIDSKTTTNDVCNIVTNEVVTGWSDVWRLEVIDESGDIINVTLDEMSWNLDDDTDPDGSGYWQLVIRYQLRGERYDEGQPSEEYINAYDSESKQQLTEIIADEKFRVWRVPTGTRNALGLARLGDLPPITNGFISAATATNIAESAAEAATEGMITVEQDPNWTAEKGEYAKTGSVAQVSSAVGTLWSYVYGDSVWIAVTNYMRTIGGVSPSFQLWEVRDGATNLVYWSKEEITNVTHDLIHDCKTNLEATVRNAVAEMPDKAWSKYQSATGNEAPDGVTIVSTPTIQLTGGGEWYRYVDVASNSVWFLKSNGLHTFGGDTNGYFRILDDEGNTTFEVRKTDSYLVDAVASSVHFDEDGNFCVSFESNIQPVIYTTASLSNPNFQPEGDDANVTVTWTQSGGVYTAKLEQAVKGPSLFAYAKVEVQGETVIRNTVPSDLQGGIIVNGVKYGVGTATISGNTVLTLTPRN